MTFLIKENRKKTPDSNVIPYWLARAPRRSEKIGAPTPRRKSNVAECINYTQFVYMLSWDIWETSCYWYIYHSEIGLVVFFSALIISCLGPFFLLVLAINYYFLFGVPFPIPQRLASCQEERTEPKFAVCRCQFLANSLVTLLRHWAKVEYRKHWTNFFSCAGGPICHLYGSRAHREEPTRSRTVEKTNEKVKLALDLTDREVIQKEKRERKRRENGI